jgi:hypothetical protein
MDRDSSTKQSKSHATKPNTTTQNAASSTDAAPKEKKQQARNVVSAQQLRSLSPSAIDLYGHGGQPILGTHEASLVTDAKEHALYAPSLPRSHTNT